MKKIIKYVFQDILRNRIVLAYTGFLLLITLSLFNLESNSTKAILSLLNIILIIVPLVSVVFATIYVYNSAEFLELLVAQPIRRKTLWLSLFFGLASSLSLAFIIGCGVPILIYAASSVGFMIIAMGVVITIIFTGIAMLASVLTRDKAKGIGISILLWFFFALIFDGIVLFILFQFIDYPMEASMVGMSLLNPLDLARILILLKLDISALMGATSAVFKEFFGATTGILVVSLALLSWILFPVWASVRRFNKKDF